MTTESHDRGGSRTATLYVREGLPTPTRQRAAAVSRRLGGLAAADVVDAVDERTWPKRIPAEGTASGLRGTYRRFADWADDAGVDLRPFFHTRECYVTGETDRTDWLVLPALCLAVSEGDDIVAVYPHRDGDEVRTVEDGIESLGAGRPDQDEAEALAAD